MSQSFEEVLRAGLHRLVDDEEPTPEVWEAVMAGLGDQPLQQTTPRARSRWRLNAPLNIARLAAVAAVIVFVAIAVNRLGILESPHVNGGLADVRHTSTLPAPVLGNSPASATTRPTPSPSSILPTTRRTATATSTASTSPIPGRQDQAIAAGDLAPPQTPATTTNPPTTITATTASPSPPAFTASTPPAFATVGTPYRYVFKASGQPTPTYTVASGSIPAGLSLDSATGVLSGSPTAPGLSTFTVSASNGTGSPAHTGSITITVA